MPGRAPRRYKMDENGTVRSAFHGKLPEEFTERDMLAFAADTDLLLFQKVSEETLVHRCINSRVNRTRYPRPLHACEASRRLHYAVASQTHR